MIRHTLTDYVDANGQTATAKRAGLSQGAIWQMLKSNRQIFVIEQDDEHILLEERRVLGRKAE